MVMKRVLLSLTLFLALVGPTIAETKLTKQSIQSMLNKMTAAVNAKDAGKLLVHFTPDAKITLHVNGRKMVTTPKQYQGLLQQTWAAAENYTYKVTGLKVELAADGKSAVVTDTTQESATIGGQKMTSVNEETLTVKLVGGKPMVTSLEGRSK